MELDGSSAGVAEHAFGPNVLRVLVWPVFQIQSNEDDTLPPRTSKGTGEFTLPSALDRFQVYNVLSNKCCVDIQCPLNALCVL